MGQSGKHCQSSFLHPSRDISRKAIRIMQSDLFSFHQRCPTASLLVVKISPFFGEFSAPLRHILPIHNVTINSNNLFVNSCWTFTFTLRNLMTEHSWHFAGLWIGAAISNTSHSNKAGSTTVKRARLTGKGSRSTAMLP